MTLSSLAGKLTEAQRLHEDLLANWDAFSDADPLPHPREDFPECLERQGYAELVPVDDDALDEAFAWERGIEAGGLMWQLTASGLSLRTYLKEQGG